MDAEEAPCAREGSPQAAPWEAAHAMCAKGAGSPVIVLAGLLFTLRAEPGRFSCPERIRKVNKNKARTINGGIAAGTSPESRRDD